MDNQNKTPLVDRIKILAKGRYPHYINLGDFERMAMDSGYVASNCRRRLQELRQKGILEKNPLQSGNASEYRWVPTPDSIPARTPEKIAEMRQLSAKLL